MKTIDEYMSLPYRLEIIPDAEEGGYAARYPELPGCITVGETIEEAVSNANDAKRAWLEAALEEGIRIAEPMQTDDFSGQFKLRIPKSLHKQLYENAKLEGLSMNQYCLFLLAQSCAQRSVRVHP